VVGRLPTRLDDGKSSGLYGGRSGSGNIAAIVAHISFRTTVVIAPAVLELSGRVDVVAADANNPADLLRRQNPLGQISLR
jgi:hypothetical protein